jgi:hypothetical protein
MKPLRALGFRMFGMPSIEDIQWAKGSVNRRTMHADRRKAKAYHGFHHRSDARFLLMRLDVINTTPARRCKTGQGRRQ